MIDISKIDRGWLDKLSPFFDSEEFSRINDTIENDSRYCNIWPVKERIFRAFEVCSYDNLKCIVIGQDPYFTKGVADGIAMSCSLTGKLQPSLKIFYDEINATIYDNSVREYDPSLDYLAKQGVLLINRALTVKENIPKSHISIWKGFIEYLLVDVIHCYQRGLPILMLGKEAQYINRYVSSLVHYPISVDHPAAASYTGGRWNCQNCFNIINKILERNNGIEFKIEWLNTQYGKQD